MNFSFYRKWVLLIIFIDIFLGWQGLPGQQQAEVTALWCLVSEVMTCTAVKTSRGVEVHRRQLDNTPLLRTGRSLKPHTSHLADINNDMTGKRILTYTNFLGSSHIPHYTKYSKFSMWQKTKASYYKRVSKFSLRMVFTLLVQTKYGLFHSLLLYIGDNVVNFDHLHSLYI